MNPRDISDVTGAEYSCLIACHDPADDLELLFQAGERMRLRKSSWQRRSTVRTWYSASAPGSGRLVLGA
jgi:hypothetical protein